MGRVGRETSAGEPVPELGQRLDRFGAEAGAAIGEADRPRDADLIESPLDQVQLAAKPRGVWGRGEIGVSPTVVADLEAHLVKLRDLPPAHEVLAVVHPAVGDEKRSAKTEFLEYWRDERAMRAHCVVESQHNEFLGGALTPGQPSGDRRRAELEKCTSAGKWGVVHLPSSIRADLQPCARLHESPAASALYSTG